ncbi:MAG: hypothetical protein M5R36_14665 [Deltaproteobacteria bacterium]|nr:hypothetical protein [Deltaproteobacteria bacterium]
MRRLEIADVELMRVAILQEIQRSEEARYDHRLHGLLLVCAGRSTYEVAEIVRPQPAHGSILDSAL